MGNRFTVRSRPIDDAKIRACASESKILADVLKKQVRRFRELFDQLCPELDVADRSATEVREFERFMLVLARVNSGHADLDALIWLAGEMERFGLPAGSPTPCSRGREAVGPAVASAVTADPIPTARGLSGSLFAPESATSATA